MKRNFSAARRGLTLIELVVVIAILAVIAVMVIPRLDFLKSQAEHASAGATMGDLATMIQTFKSSSGSYPTMDSLIDTSGNVYTALESNSIRGALTPFTPQGPQAGSTIYRSFHEAGFSYVYRHNAAATDASNSGTQPISVVDGIFTGETILATVTSGGSSTGVASTLRNAIYPGGATRVTLTAAITGTGTTEAPQFPAVYEWQTLNAGVIPTGRRLVAFGVGPKSNLVGGIMASAPKSSMAGDDSAKTYCRYIAIFEAFDDGTPARLKMVVDHRGRQVGARVDLYKNGSALN